MARLQNYFPKPQFGEHYIKSQTHGIWKEERNWRSPNPAPAFTDPETSQGIKWLIHSQKQVSNWTWTKTQIFCLIISLFPQIVLVL